MECENCGAPVPEDNINRVCAYQVDWETPDPNYKGAITCSCCDKCRADCHEQGYGDEKKNTEDHE